MSVTVATEGAIKQVRYQVTGMDCPSCATKIKKAVQATGVEDVIVSTTTQMLIVGIEDREETLSAIEQGVSAIGYRLDRLNPEDDTSAGRAQNAHITSAYRRALWIVILLNVGYGIVEIVGGYISGSQALKADALDFLGDGLITFLGILAISWSLVWRARSALVQGLFLGALGLGVVGNTAYRLFTDQPIEAMLMGVLAIIALIVNVAAALVLIPHRTGDANVRAVWLFSRNDAIGNVAVVVAAGLVAWTDSSWPDLATAFAIAGLFIHSSWLIIRDARNEL